MDYIMTDEEVKFYEELLEETPIDHFYDDQEDYFDGDMPIEQGLARRAKFFLDKHYAALEAQKTRPQEP